MNMTLPLAGWRQASEQWGFVHTRTTTVVFSIPFTKVFACVGTNTSSVGNAVPSCGITKLTTSSFTMAVYANDNVGTSDVTWMALGAQCSGDIKHL